MGITANLWEGAPTLTGRKTRSVCSKTGKAKDKITQLKGKEMLRNNFEASFSKEQSVTDCQLSVAQKVLLNLFIRKEKLSRVFLRITHTLIYKEI